MSSPSGFEFRVTQGPQAGASVPIACEQPLRVGSALDNDVVLPDAELRVVLTLSEDETLSLLVEEGQATVGDVQAIAGQTMRIALGLPMSLGRATVVVDRVGAAALARRNIDAQQVTAFSDALVHVQSKQSSSWLNMHFRKVLGFGVALVVAAGGLLTFAWATGHQVPELTQRVDEAKRGLAAAGLPMQVSVRGDQVLVSGHMGDEGQRQRVEAVLAQAGIQNAKLNLWVNDAVAHGVTEVFRLSGITSKASTTAPGQVQLETATADEATLAKAKEAALRDVPGLKQLDVVNTPPREASSARAVNDPGKRIASIVSGEPSYVVTQDGSRYFPGAVLPSGHRIQQILPNEVVLDLHGQSSRLSF